MTKYLAAALAASAVLAVAAPPKPKSNAEVTALNAMFSAPDPDSRIKAGEDALANFANTDFKPLILFTIAEAYGRKNDYAKMVVYGERALEADPNNFQADLLLAQGIARQVKENDLDHDERLNQAEKYAKHALEVVPTATKVNAQETDEQWADEKKDMIADAHQALGMVAFGRKKYDVAVDEYKSAIEGAHQPDQTTMVRLAQAYNKVNKFDEAIAIADKVMALPNVNPAVKQFAQAERVRAFQGKQAAK